MFHVKNKGESGQRTLMQGKWNIPTEYDKKQKAKSKKCDNNKQQKNTKLLAAGRNDSPMS